MLRKFTFTLAVAASITVLIPDSASAWGRFGGFGARPFGGSHFGGFGARPFGGSRVVGASLGGGPRTFSRPTMQHPTTLAKPRPTESPTTLAKPQPAIQRPTTLAKPRPTQSPTTPTIATNKNPRSPPVG